jgi:TRAP-type C4-dicarboxylate transport system permease small subunit
MSTIKMLALALIVAGVLALVYGGFTYTKESHNLKLGDLEMSVKDHETVNVPAWAGAGAVVVGAAMFFMRERTV